VLEVNALWTLITLFKSGVKADVTRPKVSPSYREIPVFIIRNNLKTVGVLRDECFQLLDQCR